MAKTPKSGTKPASKPVNGKLWVKGQSGNPRGGNEKQRVIGKVGRLKLEQCMEIIEYFLNDTPMQWQTLAQDMQGNGLRWWIANLAVKSVEDGNHTFLKTLLERVYGKATETVNIGGQPGGAPITVKMLTTEEKLERLAQLRRAREEVAK